MPICDVCKKVKPETLIALPIPLPSGQLNTLACKDCAKRTRVYCLIHERGHISFGPKLPTACGMCIDKEAAKYTVQAGPLYHVLKKELPHKQFFVLIKYAEKISAVTNRGIEYSIIHLFAVRAVRYGEMMDQVVDRVLASRSVGSIVRIQSVYSLDGPIET